MQEKEVLEARAEEIKREMYSKAEIISGRRFRRMIITFLISCLVIYIGAFLSGVMTSLKDFLIWLLVASMMAGALMLISCAVMSYMVTETIKEEKEIAKMLGQLEAIDQMKWRLF